MSLSAEAFAPAAISNFFSIHDELLGASSDLSRVGATGGGYVLSKGVRSTAKPHQSGPLKIIVNGNPNYDAKTTRKAIELLLEDNGTVGRPLEVTQTVEVPIGYGFGASAASALSGVRAVADALGLRLGAERVAYYAHAADILCRTGLGTVSVIYRFGGAGVITKAGAPGFATVRQVRGSPSIRVVTASLAPYRKEVLLSSPAMKERVNRLGDEALSRAGDLRLESLVRAGEIFSESLGLESVDVRRLVRLARDRGAIGASQNMVGNSIHAIVEEESVDGVARALHNDHSSPLVDVYELLST